MYLYKKSVLCHFFIKRVRVCVYAGMTGQARSLPSRNTKRMRTLMPFLGHFLSSERWHHICSYYSAQNTDTNMDINHSKDIAISNAVNWF